MANLEEEIRIQVTVDKSNLDKGLRTVRDDLEWFRNRAKSDTALEYSLKVAQLQKGLNEANALLRKAKKENDALAEVRITANVEILKQQLTSARGELRNFLRTGQNDVSVLGKLFASLGGGVTVVKNSLAGLGGIAAGALWIASVGAFLADAGRQAFAFNKALTQTSLVSNGTKEQMKELGDDIKRISELTGVSSSELVKVSFDLASAGIALQDIPKVMQDVAGFAVSSATDITTAFNGLYSVSTAFGISITDLTPVMDKFFRANALGKLSIEGLASAIGKVAPIANTAGVSLDELLAGFTALTGVTGSEAEVATQLRAAITSLGAPTKEAAKKFETLGIEVGQAAIAKKGFVGVMKDVYDATGGNLEVLRQLVPEIEGLNAIVQLATESNGTYVDALKQIETAYGDTSKALEKYRDTEEFELERSARVWENWKLSVGDVMVQVAAFLIKYGEKGADGLKFAFYSALIFLSSVGSKISRAAENIGYNVGIAFRAVPLLMAKAFQEAAKTTEDFLNKQIDAFNSFVGKLGADSLKVQWRVSFGAVTGTQFNAPVFRNITDGFDLIEERAKTMKDNVVKEITGIGDAETRAGWQVIDDKQKKAREAAQKLAEALAAQAKGQELLDKLSGSSSKKREDADKKAKKELEELKRKGESAHDKIISKMEQGIDKLGDYADKVSDIRKKFAELRESAVNDVREIADEISGFDQKLADTQSDKANKIAERRVAILEEQKDVEKQLAELKASGATESLATALPKETLSWLVGTGSNIGGTTPEELLKVLELLDKRVALTKELAVADASVTKEELERGQAVASRSETQKVLDEAASKTAEIEAERKSAEERIGIARSVAEGRKITLEGEGESVKAFYENEKGLLVEVSEFKNAQYAIELEGKAAALQAELDLTLASFETQKQALLTLDADRRAVEEGYTKFLGEQLKLRWMALDEYKAKLEAAKTSIGAANIPSVPAAGQSGWSGSNVSTVNNRNVNMGGVQINNVAELESFLRQFK